MKPRTRFRGLMAFVTVGSTRFDKLINAVMSDSFMELLVKQKFVRLVVQAGHSFESISSDQVESFKLKYDLDIEVMDFKPSIQEDIERSDLVISHGGAGTCLEVLRSEKRLLIVVNDTLMGNHQSELADELVRGNYVIQTSIEQLNDNFEAICDAKLNPFPAKDAAKFEEIFNEALKKVGSRL